MSNKIDESFEHSDPANFYTIEYSVHEHSLGVFSTLGEAIVNARQDAASNYIPRRSPATIYGHWHYFNGPVATVNHCGRIRYK